MSDQAEQGALQRFPAPGFGQLSYQRRPQLPALSVTDSVLTNAGADFDPSEESETIAIAALPEEEGKSYDPMLNPELDDLRVLIANKGIKGESRIREAANKKSFPLALQFEQVDQEKAFTLTLGELAASRSHEKGQQFVNPEDVKRVLFGVSGIAKDNKLSNEIQVCYFRDLAGELDPRFVITSGRHRLTAIIMILQALGIRWEKQRITVSTKIVNDDREFAQLIRLANVSRKMSGAEIRNFKLDNKGVHTSDAAAFYRTVRLSRRPECAAAFAAACNFEAEGKPLEFRNKLRAYVAGGFTKLVNGTAEQRDAAVNLIRQEGNEDRLRELATATVADLVSTIEAAKLAFPDLYDHLRVPRQMSVYLAGKLGVTAPTFEK
jgi:hypothetical protein